MLSPDDLRPRLRRRRRPRASRTSRAGWSRDSSGWRRSARATRGRSSRPARSRSWTARDGIKERHLKMAVRQDGRIFRAVAWRAVEREPFVSRTPRRAGRGVLAGRRIPSTARPSARADRGRLPRRPRRARRAGLNALNDPLATAAPARPRRLHGAVRRGPPLLAAPAAGAPGLRPAPGPPPDPKSVAQSVSGTQPQRAGHAASTTFSYDRLLTYQDGRSRSSSASALKVPDREGRDSA